LCERAGHPSAPAKIGAIYTGRAQEPAERGDDGRRKEEGMNASRIVRGFAAGFVAVLVFHQAALLVLHLAGLVPGVPWRFDPVPPLGVPAVVSAAFWGGVWGIIFVLLSPRFGRGC
jgi:hypothetical protein